MGRKLYLSLVLTKERSSLTTLNLILPSEPCRRSGFLGDMGGRFTLALYFFSALKATQTELLELRRKYDEEAASK